MIRRVPAISFPRYKIWLACVVGLVFLIGANMAWLNPNPGFKAYRTHPTIPILWQYNPDAGIEILTAAYFPDIFKSYRIRMDRPVYPAVAKGGAACLQAVAKPFRPLSNLEAAGLAYIAMKLAVYLTGILALFNLLSRYIGKQGAFIACFLCFTHFVSIEYIAAFHTTELQFITPIFTLFLLQKLVDRYSLGRNVLYSTLIGLLMLCKPNYATYLAVLAFFFLVKREYSAVLTSFAAHCIPMLLYLGYLELLGMKYYSFNADYYGQGVWLLDLLQNDSWKIFPAMANSLILFAKLSWNYYTLWLAVALTALVLFRKAVLLPAHAWLLMLGIIVMTWVQMFMARQCTPHMPSDFAFLVFGMSGLALAHWAMSSRLFSKAVPAILAVWLALNTLHFLHLPWVPPLEQAHRSQDKLKQRLDMAVHPKNYTAQEHEWWRKKHNGRK